MFRKSLAIFIFIALAGSLTAAPETAPLESKLTAAEIADRNVTARGGLQAWRAVQTMSYTGKMAAGGNRRAVHPVPMPDRRSSQRMPSIRPVDEVQLPFVMDLKRGGKMRIELQFNGQTAVQVYDGANGWKLRPFLNRRVVEPYTPQEAKTASMKADLDGPLVDYAAKGNKVDLVGMEKVDDRDTYRLKVTMKNGIATDVWIDAQTFLEAKMGGQPRRFDGAYHPVEVFFRDYHAVNGLVIPFVLETKVLPVAQIGQKYLAPSIPVEKTIIEKVAVNPNIEESRFAKPDVGSASNVN
jgi:hypothetical protein